MMNILKIPFLDGEAILAIQHGLPYIPVSPVSKVLKIDPYRQLLRVMRQREKYGLKLITTEYELALPLAELSWFLRTLRPRDAETRTRLAGCREVFPLVMMQYWAQAMGVRFMSYKNFERMLQSGSIDFNVRTGKRARRVTEEKIGEMRDLDAKGIKGAEIGRRLGVSGATVSMCLSGKYPIKVPAK